MASARSTPRRGLPELVAVCDVGGGSTQIVVGSVSGGPSWARSFDVGSLRLTHRLLEADPPAPASIAAARAAAARELAAGAQPMPQAGARDRRHGARAPPGRRPRRSTTRRSRRPS